MMMGIIRKFLGGVPVLLSVVAYTTFCQLSQNSRQDPYPMYTALDPHTFLYTRAKEEMKGHDPVYEWSEMFALHLSPFGQNAHCARDINKCIVGCGDIDGRWSLIPLLFGEFPTGVQNYPSATLIAAQQKLFPNDVPGHISVPQDVAEPCLCCNLAESTSQGPVVEANCEDVASTCYASLGDKAIAGLGFLNFPVTYRKRGLRAEFDFQITKGLGLMLQAGFADIFQVGAFQMCDTGSACCAKGEVTRENVQSYLVCKYKQIAEDLCYDLCRFHEVGIEDFRAAAWWRRAFPVNKDRDSWSEFLVIPFAEIGAQIACGKEKCPDRVFSVPFGNNGHHSVGGVLGIDLDFVDTVAIGTEVGFTHFFSRDYCNHPMPTNIYQSGIYPFRTDYTLCPGFNWQFGLKMQAYHFLDRLSCYFQYMIVTHRCDSIKLKKCDPAFKPEALERRSCWQTQFGNIGLYYDISPAITLGMLWQAPFKQKGVYRSTTLLFSVAAFF
jgi:hypothetical protein